RTLKKSTFGAERQTGVCRRGTKLLRDRARGIARLRTKRRNRDCFARFRFEFRPRRAGYQLVRHILQKKQIRVGGRPDLPHDVAVARHDVHAGPAADLADIERRARGAVRILRLQFLETVYELRGGADRAHAFTGIARMRRSPAERRTKAEIAAMMIGDRHAGWFADNRKRGLWDVSGKIGAFERSR